MKTIFTAFLIICLFCFSSCTRHVVRTPVATTVIKSTPKTYKIVKVKGKRYYFWNGNHYKKTRRGYVLVRV